MKMIGLKIQTVIDESLTNIINFRKDEGISLEKIFFAHWKYSFFNEQAVSYDAEPWKL